MGYPSKLVRTLTIPWELVLPPTSAGTCYVLPTTSLGNWLLCQVPPTLKADGKDHLDLIFNDGGVKSCTDLYHFWDLCQNKFKLIKNYIYCKAQCGRKNMPFYPLQHTGIGKAMSFEESSRTKKLRQNKPGMQGQHQQSSSHSSMPWIQRGIISSR